MAPASRPYHHGHLRSVLIDAAVATVEDRSDQPDADRMAAGIAAWALMHGVATLWLNGNMPPPLGDDPEAIARLVAVHLDVAGLGGPGAGR